MNDDNDAVKTTEQWMQLHAFMLQLQQQLLIAIANPQDAEHRLWASSMITVNQNWIQGFEETVQACVDLKK